MNKAKLVVELVLFVVDAAIIVYDKVKKTRIFKRKKVNNETKSNAS